MASSSSSTSKTAGITAYDYIAVLDFEATCERDAKNYPHEVIEMPTVMLRVVTKDGVETVEPAGEFHEYVKPVMNGGKLTAFCTELTGIEQATVD